MDTHITIMRPMAFGLALVMDIIMAVISIVVATQDIMVTIMDTVEVIMEGADIMAADMVVMVGTDKNKS